MSKDENIKNTNNEDTVEIDETLDEEALDVVFRLYDKTIKDLVDR